MPVYVHVMRDANGNGDVSDRQVAQQIAELNQDFAGGESSAAANLGFTFHLAGLDRTGLLTSSRPARAREPAGCGRAYRG